MRGFDVKMAKFNVGDNVYVINYSVDEMTNEIVPEVKTSPVVISGIETVVGDNEQVIYSIENEMFDERVCFGSCENAIAFAGKLTSYDEELKKKIFLIKKPGHII